MQGGGRGGGADVSKCYSLFSLKVFTDKAFQSMPQNVSMSYNFKPINPSFPTAKDNAGFIKQKRTISLHLFPG